MSGGDERILFNSLYVISPPPSSSPAVSPEIRFSSASSQRRFSQVDIPHVVWPAIDAPIGKHVFFEAPGGCMNLGPCLRGFSGSSQLARMVELFSFIEGQFIRNFTDVDPARKVSSCDPLAAKVYFTGISAACLCSTFSSACVMRLLPFRRLSACSPRSCPASLSVSCPRRCWLSEMGLLKT